MAEETGTQVPDESVITRAFFQEYMDAFLVRLDERFSQREACKLRHEAIERRLTAGDDKFDDVCDRLGALEKRMYLALGVFAAFEFALRQGWLKL